MFKDSPHMEDDMINHPPHYKGKGGMEVIDVIEAFDLDKNWNLANVIKYVLRSGSKGKMADNLEKAGWYLNRAIANTHTQGQFDWIKDTDDE